VGEPKFGGGPVCHVGQMVSRMSCCISLTSFVLSIGLPSKLSVLSPSSAFISARSPSSEVSSPFIPVRPLSSGVIPAVGISSALLSSSIDVS
jgi:hypothetical protein